MNKHLMLCAVVALWIPAASIRSFAQDPAMPPGMTHEEHRAQLERDAAMKKRGAQAMGFDQDGVAHHFVLRPDGGLIEVDVRDASDETNRDAIRTHLRQIATAFAGGNFEGPLMTHAEMPPGVPALQRLKSRVTYTFEETPRGGRVRITTDAAEALAAVHEFLQYQIREHHTGDPTVAKQ
jgi:hypothetical protein